MFAPTFREGARNGKRAVFSEVWTIDFKRMLDNLEKRFGGSWFVCVRVHPQLAPGTATYKNEQLHDRVIDVSQDDDMYEDLAAMDAFVTDFSSAAFDAGYARMPVFIYADDIEQYMHERGSMLWNLSKNCPDFLTNNRTITPGIQSILPFSISVNNDELEKSILDFNSEEYNALLDDSLASLGVIFDGDASRKVVDSILQEIS